MVAPVTSRQETQKTIITLKAYNDSLEWKSPMFHGDYGDYFWLWDLGMEAILREKDFIETISDQ